MTPENLFDAVSEEGAMNEYLKANDIQLAAQRATAVLSVVNHAELTEVEPADRMKVQSDEIRVHLMRAVAIFSHFLLANSCSCEVAGLAMR